MKLSHHPEYEALYLRHQDLDTRCRQAISAWQVNGYSISVAAYDLVWTLETARQFALDLSRMFQAYNQVLWAQFSYCRDCGGQCCVLDAADIRPFDFIAATLLDLTMPTLPETSPTTLRDCIYLHGQRCAWPSDWRTIKCWSFYCLGSGYWAASDQAGELYQAVTAALHQVVRDHLPDPLRRYEAVHGLALTDYLDDPVAFADATHQALLAIFIAPLHAQFPLFDQAAQQTRLDRGDEDRRSEIPLIDHELPIFIVEATELIDELMPTASPTSKQVLDQLLADLEALEWIMLGQPQHKVQLLEAIHHRYRYAPAPEKGQIASLWSRMRDYTAQLQKD